MSDSIGKISKYMQFGEDYDELMLNDGDLIEIDNGIYQHWGVYVDGDIIHLSGESKQSAVVAREIFEIYVNQKVQNMLWRINNSLDSRFQPYEPDEIVKRAEKKIGKGGYNLLRWNCECFANWCRYGPRGAISQQVIKAINKIAASSVDAVEFINTCVGSIPVSALGAFAASASVGSLGSFAASASVGSFGSSAVPAIIGSIALGSMGSSGNSFNSSGSSGNPFSSIGNSFNSSGSSGNPFSSIGNSFNSSGSSGNPFSSIGNSFGSLS